MQMNGSNGQTGKRSCPEAVRFETEAAVVRAGVGVFGVEKLIAAGRFSADVMPVSQISPPWNRN
jgi:hypothetical protein